MRLPITVLATALLVSIGRDIRTNWNWRPRYLAQGAGEHGRAK